MISETIVVCSTVHQLSFWTTAENQQIFVSASLTLTSFWIARLKPEGGGLWWWWWWWFWICCSVLMKQGWRMRVKSPRVFDPFSCCSYGKSCDCFQENDLSCCAHYLYGNLHLQANTIWFPVYEAYLTTFYWKLKPLETEPDEILIWTELTLASRTGFEEQIILWTLCIILNFYI